MLAVTLLSLVGMRPSVAQAPAAALASTSATSADAHAALRRVLAGREFQTYRDAEAKQSRLTPAWMLKAIEGIKRFFGALTKPINKFFEGVGKIFRSIGQFFKRIFRITPTPSSSDAATGKYPLLWHYCLYIVIIAAALFLIGLVVSRFVSARRLRDATEELDALVGDQSVRRRQEPSFWERSLQQAEALWSSGNQREPLRLLYRACLVLLDARGVLRYDESRANGEVLRELRRQGRTQVQQTLRPIVGSFDRSWYGFLHVSDDEFSATLEHSRRFREAVVEVHNA